LNGRRGDQSVIERVTASMQNLHTNFTPGFVYGISNLLVLSNFFIGLQTLGTFVRTAFQVWANPSGNDQANATAGTFGKIHSHTLMAIWFLFQAGMHGTHEDTVFQRGKTQIQRFQQPGVFLL